MTVRAHLPALTSLRFVLALWVVLYHLLRAWLLAHDGALRDLIAGAPAAVPAFFVLSGFVLTWTYRETLDVRRYARARVARIAPLYLVGVLLCVPVGFVARNRGLVDDPMPLASLAAVTLGVQAWVPSFALRWNPALWSVSVEVFLYACVPLLLPRMRALAPRRALVLAYGSALIAAAPALAYLALAPDGPMPGRLDDEGTWLHVVRFNPLLRLCELIAGMCAAQAFMRGARVPVAAAVLACAAGALVLASGRVPTVLVQGGGGVVLALTVVLALAGVERGPLVARVPVALGEASYALYVLHLPVWFWMLGLTKRAATDFSWGFACVVLVVSIAIARAAHKLIEEPARRAWNRAPSSGS